MALADHCLQRLEQGVVAEIRAILDEEFETADSAQPHHRRRRHGKNKSVLDRGKLPIQRSCDRGAAEVRLPANFKGFQTEEDDARVRSETESTNAQYGERHR